MITIKKFASRLSFALLALLPASSFAVGVTTTFSDNDETTGYVGLQ